MKMWPQATPQHWLALIDLQTVHIAPVGAYRWQAHYLKKPAQQRVKPYVAKMSDPIEPDKQQHHYTHHHPVVPQFCLSGRFCVTVFKEILKLYQVQ